MTPERWQQIEAVYVSALERPPDERAAYLERACAGDPDLRREVDSLLAADAVDDSFMEQPLVQRSAVEAFAAEEESDEADALERVGPYRLIRPLGRGGMGQVYLAVRDDDDFTQQVAVKVLRRGLDTDDILRRFRTERQILARLNHPNIAHLYDGGATTDGRPYFVLEHVDGLPIAAYCDRHRLSVDARLRLFRRVCDAVQYAHRNLVVHRDLKPSNILVTEEGAVKLLDFGIAKLLDPQQWEGTVLHTRSEVRVLTPEYAAPEQVRGEAVTTATDVYALGVLLYELLVGQRPYRIERRVQDEIERIVCEEAPERPSMALRRIETAQSKVGGTTAEQVSAARGTRIEQLRRRLRGDLDTIVLMALRKKPARRYATVEQLAEDVDRHLNGLPVRARPNSLTYRVSKFVRRHRVGVAATAGIAVLLVAFSVVTTLQARQIQAQSVQVAQERDRAEAVIDFLVDLFEASDPNEAQGETITARTLLARGAERLEEDLADEPAVQAEMTTVMSRVYEQMGQYEQGEQLARRSLRMNRRLYGNESPEVATALNSVGWLLYQQGQYAASDSVLREALAMRRALLGSQHLDVARTLNDLAVIQQAQGDHRATDALLQEALSIRRRQLGDAHPSVATTLNNVAALKWRLGEYEAAEAQMREVLAMLREQYGTEHMRVAIATSNLAALLMSQSDYEGAEPLYREALATRRVLLGDEHPDVAHSLVHLGNLLRVQDQHTEAASLLHEALAMRRKLLGKEHRLVADTQHLLALLYHRMRDYERAERFYREALAVFKTALPDGHSKTAEALMGMGRVYVAEGRSDRAEPILRNALEMQQNNFGSAHALTVKAQMALGSCLTALEQYAEAESLLVRSHTVLRDRHGPDHSRTRKARAALTRLYDAWGKDERTRP